MQKLIACTLSAVMLVGAFSTAAVSAEEEPAQAAAPTAFQNHPAIYAHAVLGGSDVNAWQEWQSAHDEEFYEEAPSEKYFFLPNSADRGQVDLYNAYEEPVTVNGVTIASKQTERVSYQAGTAYSVAAAGSTYTLKLMNSNAEAAIYINNSNADGNGTDLMTYLNSDKSLSAKATGAIVSPDGKVDNTAVKKIKGRGNTSWDKEKKGYNITYDKKVSIAGMASSKKYSILANYQDDSLVRNRLLYDLSDAVGMPYASDSRFVDFYVNGYYWGSYQMAEKVEVGSSSLVNDFEETDYLNEDGTIKEDFPFVCEVDASAGDDDYYFRSDSGNKITIKAPEIDLGDPGYDEVKAYVKSKFEAFYNSTTARGDVSAVADVDSLTKLFLINELGKNWDSGVSSTFFTYKQDENGNYKFYGSPVWDYDNTLGNANGVARDLQSIGVTDYTKYTGWWCMYKGKGSGKKQSTNIMNRISQNKQVTEAAPKIWFECFVPAMEHFTGEKYSAAVNDDFFTCDAYYDLIHESAEMNYASGWLLKTGSWIADHTSLKKATFDPVTLTLKTDADSTRYTQDHKGLYQYCVDWFTSRAAWISSQYASSHNPLTAMIGDVTSDSGITIEDATMLQKILAQSVQADSLAELVSDVNNDGKVTIDDATCIQRYIAQYEQGYGKAGNLFIYG